MCLFKKRNNSGGRQIYGEFKITDITLLMQIVIIEPGTRFGLMVIVVMLKFNY